MEKLLVARTTEVKSLAGAISNIIKQGHEVRLQAVGAGAVNQAVKAIAVAGGYLAPYDMEVMAQLAFAVVEFDGEEKTAITMKVSVIKELQ